MRTIAMVCQKGGVSKTTTALNLAVEAERRGVSALVVDLDPQCSASDWKDMRGERGPAVAATVVPHLTRVLAAAETAGVQLVIVDTAGRSNDAAVAAARAADLVIIPLQPSLIDLKTLASTMDVIRIGGARKVVALLTRVRTVGRQLETENWLGEQGVEVLDDRLGERVEFQDAYALGQGVVESAPTSKAAIEVRKVYNHICTLVGMSTSGEAA
jgi:chromosome partitioning protein